MRLSTAYTFNASVSSLQRRQEALTRAQEQMTSLKRVSKPSDDPIAAARAERALAEQTYGEQLQRGIDASKNAMGLTEGALGQATELIQSVRETLVDAGNGSYTASERSILAGNLRELRSQLLSLANQSDGAGGYLFSGQAATEQPFVDAVGGDIQKRANIVGGEVGASNEERLPVSIDGPGLWLTSTEGDSIFKTIDTALGVLEDASASSTTVSAAVKSGLTGVDSSLERFIEARASVGETLKQLDNLTTRTADRVLAAKTTRSNAEDLDMIQAASDFSNKQTSYQAALQSYAMVQKLSLFNYIN